MPLWGAFLANAEFLLRTSIHLRITAESSSDLMAGTLMETRKRLLRLGFPHHTLIAAAAKRYVSAVPSSSGHEYLGVST
jgi:hypothetical protein